MNKKLKKSLLLIIAAGLLFALSWLPIPQNLQIGLLLVSYFIVGWEIILKALRNIIRGQVFDENFLMSLATFGAWYLGEYAEAVAVMLFFQVGEFFQKYAVNRSRQSISALMNIRPDYANVLRHNKIIKVSPEDVKVGEIIVVKAGERVPLDGLITKGDSSLDTAALTGESLPRDVTKGDEVLSGCINLSGVIEVKTTKEYGMSTVAKILDLVENASSQKAELENFITRFAKWYTPIVVFLALFIAIIPPMLGFDTFREWSYRAITFLVVSCPCALVISIPLSFFGGIGAASKCGVLVKGGNYLEALSKVHTAVFDKTGTLTKGKFVISEIRPQGISKEKLLETAAYIESMSSHPIALAIKAAWNQKFDLSRIDKIEEISGKGITAEFDGKKVAAGNIKMLQDFGVSLPQKVANKTAVYIVIDGKYSGFVAVEDELKNDAPAAISSLKQQGITQTVMLTGDNKHIAAKIGKILRLDKVFAELLPADKLAKLEQLMKQKPSGSTLVFVGDGINDAPSLARSDIGIAMGGIGSDAAIEAADVVIMTDEPYKIVDAIRIARGTVLIARENVIFAIGVKLLVLGLGACGLASIWAAVFADVGVSVIAILNAVRALRLYKK